MWRTSWKRKWLYHAKTAPLHHGARPSNVGLAGFEPTTPWTDHGLLTPGDESRFPARKSGDLPPGDAKILPQVQ